MHSKTLAELGRGLRAGEFSSVELTGHFLDRVSQFESLNAFITVDGEGALAAAAKADQLLAGGSAGPLTGIPIAHKDIFCTEALRTTCGSRMLADFVPPYDATVVARLRQAATVMIGKTNMDEFAMGSSNENSAFGPCANPWDQARVPGGSSGGSAVAVAAGLAAAATGTDTGGSVRQPAAMTGLTGIKPTYGRVSRYGMIAFASSLDQAGVLCRDVHDAALLMQAMAGFDEKDSTSVDAAVPDYTGELKSSVKGLRIGVAKEFFGDGLDAAVGAAVEAALRELCTLGAELVDISLPNIGLSVPAYYVVAPAEASSNLARYDGVRYGHRCDNPRDLDDLYQRSRAEGFGDEVKRRIMTGTYVLSAGYFDAYYLRAQRVRQLISDDFKNAFDTVDVIIGPTAPTTAFKIGQKTSDPIKMYLNDIYTTAANLAGLPALSVPCGFVEGLPVGLQVIGAHFAESRILNTAFAYQQATDWHRRSPVMASS